MKSTIVIMACIGFTVITAGCHQNMSVPTSDNISNLSAVGAAHNELLDTFFTTVRSARSGVSSWSEEFNKMFPSEMKIVTTDNCDPTKQMLCDVMEDAGVIVPEAEPILRNIESVLRDPPETREELEAFFTESEKQIAHLSDDAATQVIAYLNTARASLAYWYQNFDSLSLEFLGKGLTADAVVLDDARASIDTKKIKAWWLKNRKKIAMCIASDAAGAAVGALTSGAIGIIGATAGMATAAAIPVIAGSAAAVGAVITGTASSIQGFMNENFTVVLPNIIKQSVTSPQNTPTATK